MSDTDVESLNTVAPISAKEIVENIKECANECAKSHDYISFSTILDVYLNDWSVYTVEERIEFIELLYEVLDGNKQMLAEIAWDLPPLLIAFLDCDWPIRFGLKESIQIVWFYKIFGLLAEYGNPKELLLTCCELLSNLKDPIETDEPISEDKINEVEANLDLEYKMKWDDLDSMIKKHLSLMPDRKFFVQFHAFFQCIKFCVERVKTLYPSKFLGIVVSTVLKFTKSAPVSSGNISVLRSLYLFIRDYTPPDIPENILNDPENTEDRLNKIFEDESYLQRKLMRLLLDTIVMRITQCHPNIFIAKLLPTLLEMDLSIGISYLELANRLLTLSISLDFNIASFLTEEIEDAKLLFDNNIYLIKTTEDIIKLVIVSYNNTSFGGKNPTKLPRSSSTLVFLYVYAKYIENMKIELPDEIPVMSLVKLQLTIFIPYMVDPTLTNPTIVTYLMVMTILKIESKKCIASKEEFKDPTVRLLILTYLQNISSIVCNTPNSRTKKLYSRFIKKFLQYLPDEISYDYIWDTINNCPFDDNILCILSVYKNLISSARYDYESLVADFSKLPLNESTENAKISEKPLPPPLPERSVVNFITFTTERQNAFIDLVNKSINDTFGYVSKSGEKPESIGKFNFDILKSNRLLSYLNFVNSAKFEDKEKVLSIYEDISALSNKLKKTEDFGKDPNMQVVVDLIDFAVDSGIKSCK